MAKKVAKTDEERDAEADEAAADWAKREKKRKKKEAEERAYAASNPQTIHISGWVLKRSEKPIFTATKGLGREWQQRWFELVESKGNQPPFIRYRRVRTASMASTDR